MSMSDRALGKAPARAAARDRARDYFALLKPRVMSLVVFTGVVGLVMAPGEMHPLLAVAALLFIALGAGASGAINMWYDADIDAVMERTKRRPIPAGRVARSDALTLGLVVGGASILGMALLVNLFAAGLLAFTIAFYVFVYTMWLKRRSTQNIVIGGVAGALPPVIGWVAVTGELSAVPLVLFAIIFFWTPPHFWALALYRRDEFARAGLPMLPVVRGAAATRRQILLYSHIVAPLGVVPPYLGAASWIYGAGAELLGAVFIYAAYRVYRYGAEEERAGTHTSARRLFGFSILYLSLIFAGLLVDHSIGLAARL